jgi:hypothetical protein
MRVGRRTAAGLAIALASLLSGAVAAAVAPPQSTSNVTAYGDFGRRLPADPGLFVGDRVRLVVTGFAANVSVSVHVQGTSRTVTAHAGRTGILEYLFVVPRLPNGHYVLAFVGTPPLRRPPPWRTASASPGSDVANIVAVVPRIGLFPFRIVDPGSGVDGQSASNPGSGGGAGVGGLSDTGADIGGPLLLALVLLAVGIAAIILGRRHRVRRH